MDQTYGFILLCTLSLVPLLSFLSGRLDSLAIDLLGSGISLLLSFVDAITRNPQAKGFLGIAGYILVGTLVVTFLCITCNISMKRIRKANGIDEGKYGGAYPEALYWFSVVLATFFLIFSFNLNLASEMVVNHQNSLYDFFAFVFSYNIGSTHLFAAAATLLLACAAMRYAYIPNEWLTAKSLIRKKSSEQIESLKYD